jgi:hypothetical protein
MDKSKRYPTMTAAESPSDRSLQRSRALSRWENEGGAVCQPHEASDDEELASAPLLTNTELLQLRIRVIALENLVIALLARAPAEQLELVRELAAYISPRPGFTHHPMTIRAASEMLSLLDRSGQFRSD